MRLCSIAAETFSKENRKVLSILIQGIDPLFAQFKTVLRLTPSAWAMVSGPTSGWFLGCSVTCMPPAKPNVLLQEVAADLGIRRFLGLRVLLEW